MVEFGRFDLGAWRRWLGLSQREVAAMAGISTVAVAEAERGEHDAHPSTLAALARAFGVSRSVLLHEQPEEAWARGWRPPEHEALIVPERKVAAGE